VKIVFLYLLESFESHNGHTKIILVRHLTNVFHRKLQNDLGGSKIILKYAGKDATYVFSTAELYVRKLTEWVSQEYEPIHPPDAITTNLPPEKQLVYRWNTVYSYFTYAVYSLGPVEPDTVEKVEVVVTDEEKARQERMSNKPPLDEILNLHDFEVCIYIKLMCIEDVTLSAQHH